MKNDILINGCFDSVIYRIDLMLNGTFSLFAFVKRCKEGSKNLKSLTLSIFCKFNELKLDFELHLYKKKL